MGCVAANHRTSAQGGKGTLGVLDAFIGQRYGQTTTKESGPTECSNTQQGLSSNPPLLKAKRVEPVSDLAMPAFPGQESRAELDLIESRPLRDRNASRTEVLDKVKALTLLPGDTFATVELVAAYYEVAPEAVKSAIYDHRDEVESDGLKVLSGPRLSSFKESSGLTSRAPSLTVVPRRAILRLGMLLRDSAVAKQVRTYLLDTEQQFTVPQTFAEALELAARQARAIEAAAETIAELEPKAEAHDTYLVASNGERLVREVAKLLSWRERDLRAFLVAQRFLFTRHAGCGQTQYDVYAEHRTRFRPVEHVVTHGDAGPCSHYTIYVLPSGIELIRTRIAKHAANELEATR